MASGNSSLPKYEMCLGFPSANRIKSSCLRVPLGSPCTITSTSTLSTCALKVWAPATGKTDNQRIIMIASNGALNGDGVSTAERLAIVSAKMAKQIFLGNYPHASDSTLTSSLDAQRNPGD